MMLTRRSFAGLALAGTAGLVVSACAPRAPQQPSIREVIDSNASLSTLARLLANAGVASLSDPGPWTVFAPRNSAFDRLPEGEVDRLLEPANRAELTRLVQLHVVSGRYLASDLTGRTTTLTTLAGTRVIVDGFNGVKVGGVAVVQPDVMAGNGVLHVIDGIIKPARSTKKGPPVSQRPRSLASSGVSGPRPPSAGPPRRRRRAGRRGPSPAPRSRP